MLTLIPDYETLCLWLLESSAEGIDSGLNKLWKKRI